MSENDAASLALSQRYVAAGQGTGPRIEIGASDGLAVSVKADGSREVLIGLPPPDAGPPPGWPVAPCDCCLTGPDDAANLADGVTLHLTQAEADALYFYTQGDDCPDYWTTPLNPVGHALARWYREGTPSGWSNRQ